MRNYSIASCEIKIEKARNHQTNKHLKPRIKIEEVNLSMPQNTISINKL